MFHKKKVSKLLLWGITIGIAVIFIAMFFRADTLSVLSQLGLAFTLVLVLLSIVTLLEDVYATQILLSGMGYKKPFGMLYLISTASMPANYTTPGKVGIPIKLFLYKKLLDIPVSAASASISIYAVIGILTAALISSAAILSIFSEIGWLLQLLVAIFVAMIMGFAFFRFSGPVSQLLPKIIGQSSVVKKAQAFFTDFVQSIRTVPPRTLLIFVGLLLVRLIIRGLVTYLILMKIDTQVSLINILYIQSMSGLIGIFSMIPMGIGVKELSTVTLFRFLDVSTTVATLVATIERVLWTVVPMLLGLVSIQQLGFNTLMNWNSLSINRGWFD